MNLPEFSDLDLRSASASDLCASRDRIVHEAVARATADIRAAIAVLERLEFITIDEKTLVKTDPLLRQIAAGRTVVATCDVTRKPTKNEVVIVYGNYPHVFANVVINNPIKRHCADFWKFHHDSVEYDTRWDALDQIFIINVNGRTDRWDAVLRELALARAPFHRITRVSACEPLPEVEDAIARPLACLRSHIKALRLSRDLQLQNVLILEDDYCFTADLEDHLADLQTFFARGYDYWICLIATSKYGAVLPLDDLLGQSFQECTNAAGYLVSSEGRTHLIPLFEEAADRMQETGDAVSYAADRCWAALQSSGRFLVFLRKLGFQGASFSDIERSIARYLD